MTPRSDARARDLDGRILAAVEDWHAGGVGLQEDAFEALALDLFVYQRAANEPYGRFASLHEEPRSWRDIPAVPTAAFKDATLATFDALTAELVFHTSGTTGSGAGRHYFQRAALYDAVLLAGFDRFMLPDRVILSYLVLAPDPRLQRHSSLGYMLAAVGERRGASATQFYVGDVTIDVDALCADLEHAERAGAPVCIAGTAFAFVALLEALESTAKTFSCAAGSRVMETGGFKGRTRVVERASLYRRLSARLGVPEEHIVAEYGMTELTSQYYDTHASRANDLRVKAGPPWLRAVVVDAEGRELSRGDTGFLRHIDLANRSSVIAVQTEDRGYATDDGFVLLGRDLDAPLRGCSLDAEELAARHG